MREAEPDDPVQEFIAVANEFCRLVEKKHRSKRVFARQALRLTVALYGSGLRLPDCKPERGLQRPWRMVGTQ
jgi:hypothetical protein